jgi:RNA-directed DNA polymerase
MSLPESKPFLISKHSVLEAWKRVKANQGAAGIDEESIQDFEHKLKDNLYRIWNRMSSGSYLPPPVKTVAIPKTGGGERKLGIPTVADRVAQMVVKMHLEPKVEPLFHPDSYGYRPLKSAHDAVGQARKRCWKYDWVLDLDIKGFFDNIPHELLMRAVRKHAPEKWVVLYVERWLKAPAQNEQGQLTTREKGTPQGGVASPLLANLFLHYGFDAWMARKYPSIPFERYADDAIVHCRTKKEAESLREAIILRMAECGLELNLQKTKIVYCQDADRRGTHEHEKFTFLGYEFRPRRARNHRGEILRELPAGYKRHSCKGHPRGNPRLETPIAERQILGRPGADVQSHPARVDAVLREILSFDASSGLSPLKPTVSALGLPEIQETPRSSAPGHPLAQTDLHPVCAALGPLANRSQGSDLITGAG